MRKKILRIAVGAVTLYVGVVGLAWAFQERLAFPGARGPLPDPTAAGFSAGEIVWLDTADSSRVGGWYLPPDPMPDTGRAPGLLWLHGNRENIGDIAPTLRQLRPPGTGVLVIDYRGYGETPGYTTEDNAYADAEVGWDALVKRDEIDPTRIALYGRSVGAAVALELATRRDPVAVVLDSPFSSARAMARRHYPFLPAFLRRMRLDNLANAARLRVPLLVFHGERDYIAPLTMGRAVSAAGRGTLMVLPGVGHNGTYGADPEAYRDAFHAALHDAFER